MQHPSDLGYTLTGWQISEPEQKPEQATGDFNFFDLFIFSGQEQGWVHLHVEPVGRELDHAFDHEDPRGIVGQRRLPEARVCHRRRHRCHDDQGLDPRV